MSSIAHLRKEKKRANNKNNLEDVANICNLLGAELVEAGEYRAALQEHREEASIFEALNDEIGVAIANRRLGEVYSELQEWEKALDHQNKYLSLALKCENFVEEQRAYATIGRTQMQRSEIALLEENKELQSSTLAESEKAFLKALSTCQKIGDKIDGKELAQMRCRVYHNLGLVVDLKGESSDAIKFVSQSLELCLEYDFAEDAYRSYSELARMHLKMEKSDKALEEARLSLKFGTKLQKKNFIADSHQLIAQIQLVKEDFLGAKKSCYKAYKGKHPDKGARAGIEKNLKLIVYICSAMDEISRPETDDETRLKYLDKIGDSCAALGLYKQAIHFYEQRLDLALEKGKDGSFLAPIYTSLAQTYKDLKQYKKAFEYFNRELNIHLHTNHKEAIITLIEIAKISENLLQDYYKVSSYFDQALQIAEKSALHKYEGIIINAYLTASGLPSSKRESLEEQLERIQSRFDEDFEFTDDDDGSENEEIDLDYIEFSDSDEETTRKQRSRRVNSGLKLKVNERGESPLHQAVIKNEVNLVKKLLESNHPVNIRDNSGWLPIHEACNWGFLEIAELLIVAGAWINDKGGRECSGTTPLHDATTNYHYDVVKLLVESGASIFAKDDAGNTPLDLVKLIKINNLSDEALLELDKTKKFLIERMERAGYKVSDSLKITRRNNHELNGKLSTRTRDYVQEIEAEELPDLEDNSDCESVYIPKFSSANSQKNSATESYKTAMQSVGSHSKRSNENKRRSSESAKNSLVPEDEYVMNDWLIDDLETTKKRKRSFEKCEFEYKEKNRRSDNLDYDVTSFNNSSSSISTTKKKSRQPNLTSLLKKSSLTRSSNSLNNNNRVVNLDEESEIRDKTDLFCSPVSRDCNYSASSARLNGHSSHSTPGPPLRLLVRVLQNKITVPVAHTAQSNTIGWLEKEASKRYFQYSGVKRILKLYSLKDEILNSDDVISEVLSTNNRELKATVTGTQDCDSMSEIYNKICRELGATSYVDVASKLKDCESLGGIDFSRLNLRSEDQYKPIFTSIQFQNIQYLNFNSCRLGDDCMMDLIQSLPSLPLVESLKAEACSITSKSFDNLSNFLNENPILKISNFNLSYNDFSKVTFSTFLNFLSFQFLCELKVVACDMSFRIGENNIPSKVSKLYMDENHVDMKALSTIISSCPLLTHLSIRECAKYPDDLSLGNNLGIILGAGDCCLLQHLNISACNVTSNDLNSISPYFYRCKKLASLNISNNLHISSDSVLSLLKELSVCSHSALNTLNIHGIESLEKSLEFGSYLANYIEKKAYFGCPLVSLSVPNSVRSELVKRMWFKIYKERAVVKTMSKVIFLTLKCDKTS